MCYRLDRLDFLRNTVACSRSSLRRNIAEHTQPHLESNQLEFQYNEYNQHGWCYFSSHIYVARQDFVAYCRRHSRTWQREAESNDSRFVFQSQQSLFFVFQNPWIIQSHVLILIEKLRESLLRHRAHLARRRRVRRAPDHEKRQKYDRNHVYNSLRKF